MRLSNVFSYAFLDANLHVLKVLRVSSAVSRRLSNARRLSCTLEGTTRVFSVQQMSFTFTERWVVRCSAFQASIKRLFSRLLDAVI